MYEILEIDFARSGMPVKFTFSNTIMKTWLLIHQSDTLQKKAEKMVLAKVGLTTQTHSILLALEYIPQPVKVRDVARWLDRNPNAISMRIDLMEKEELVIRTRDTHDHRAVCLEMTPRGKKLFDKANKLTWKLFQSFFIDLSEDELVTLRTLMEKVRLKAFSIVNPGKPTDDIQTISEREEFSSTLGVLDEETQDSKIPDDDE
jgi:DNA-binding MarR family transcriptional regulator